jgi:hypothetical protein
MEDPKQIKVAFAPGCFDKFEGTQEELDDLMAEIGKLIQSGELFNNSVPIDDLDDEELRILAEDFGQADKRNLQ